jgi:hypothetical protein
MDAARKEILRKFSGFGKKNEYSTEVKQIADALTLQPLLVKPMALYLQKLVTSIQSAVNDAIVKLENES